MSDRQVQPVAANDSVQVAFDAQVGVDHRMPLKNL